ncbi:MAG: TraB/GumN family protein, partial [Sphingomonas sp.]
MLKSLYFALVLGLAAPALAQTDIAPAPAEAGPAATPPPATTLPDADPALWVLRDEDTTIYLFGTFHMLDGRPWFNDEIRTAFDASSELVLEAIMPEDQGAIAALTIRSAIDPQGRTLSGRLTARENERLAAVLAEMGIPAVVFDRFEPWYVSLAITVSAIQRAGLVGAHGAENVLSAAARERNMPIAQLESFEAQLAMLDGIPEDLQLVQLRATLDELARLPEILQPALAAWSRGDIEEMTAVMDDPTNDDPRLRRIFLADRNARW